MHQERLKKALLVTSVSSFAYFGLCSSDIGKSVRVLLCATLAVSKRTSTSNSLERFLPELQVVGEHPSRRHRPHPRFLLLHAPHHQAQVADLGDDNDVSGLQSLDYGVGDLGRQALLHVQAASEHIDEATLHSHEVCVREPTALSGIPRPSPAPRTRRPPPGWRNRSSSGQA